METPPNIGKELAARLRRAIGCFVFFPLAVLVFFGVLDFDCTCATRPWTHIGTSWRCGPTPPLVRP